MPANQPPRALISGITGQDGSYLAELLLSKGYEVHGIERSLSFFDRDHRFSRITHILAKLTLHYGTMESYPLLDSIISKVQPDEVYHLAAKSLVREPFDESFSTLQTNIQGTHHMLAAVHQHCPHARFFFAASSEMFGNATETPQTESTPFRPRSPYGISKVAGYELVRNYREKYGLHASTGIMFNHESPRRGHEFVTRKITMAVARIAAGENSKLILGNLNSKRDWGYAPEYVEAMWLMLQQNEPGDFVLATGQTHSVAEFCMAAFEYANLYWPDYVQTDANYDRPEVEVLVGDASKAGQVLRWVARSLFPTVVVRMMEAEMKLLAEQGVPA